MSTSSEIAKILLEAKAVTLRPSAPFTFASGLKSPVYTDNRLLLSLPRERRRIIAAYVAAIKSKGWEPDVIAGVATAGIPWAAWIAAELGLPMVFVRGQAKEYGKNNQVEGTLSAGQRVVVIEDLVSTGSSTMTVVSALKEKGAHVLGCAAITTYGFQKARDSFGATPLVTLTDFETTLAVALSEKIIAEQDAALAHAWRKDPDGWLK